MKNSRSAFLKSAQPISAADSGVGVFNAGAVITAVAAKPVSEVLAVTFEGVSSVVLRAGTKVLAAVPVECVEQFCAVIDRSPMFLGVAEYEDFQDRIREAAAKVRAAMVPGEP